MNNSPYTLVSAVAFLMENVPDAIKVHVAMATGALRVGAMMRVRPS